MRTPSFRACCALLALMLLVAFGCKKEAEPQKEDKETDRTPAAQKQGETAPVKAKIKIEKADGTLLYRIECKGDKCKLYDANDTYLASVKNKGEKKKVYGPDEAELYDMKQKEYGYKVKNAAEEELYKLKLYADGDYKIKTAVEGETLFEIKPKENGFKIENAQGELARIRQKDDKVVIENAQGEETMRIKGMPPIAAAVMALETLDIKLRLGFQMAVRDMSHVKPE